MSREPSSAAASRPESGYHQLVIRVLPGSGNTFSLLAESTAESAKPWARTEIDVHIRSEDIPLERLGDLLFKKIFLGGINAAYVINLFDARRTSRPGVRILLD